MIVLSAGMQKSGTGWYWNMTNELLMAAGYSDSRETREKHQLQSLLTTTNCHLPKLRDEAILELEKIGREVGFILIKTHRRPTKLVRKLMAEGRLKATYIYRDLRDVMVSALDRGRVMRETGDLRGRHFLVGPHKSFAKYHTVRGAILWAKFRLLPVWKAWTQCEDDGVLVTRYESLHADAPAELRRLAQFLKLRVSDNQIESIVAAYDRSRISTAQHTPVHFNKGVTGRFKEVLNEEQQQLCRRRLGRYLQMMGYAD